MPETITDLLDEIDRKPKDCKIEKVKICLVCARCGKVLQNTKTSCPVCHGKVAVEIEIKKIIIIEKEKARKLRGK